MTDDTMHLSDDPSIADAIKWYLAVRESELSNQTHRSHRYRLQHLPQWADEHESVQTVGDLTPKTLYEYREWRRRDGDLAPVSLHTQLATVRVFVKRMESIGLVDEGTGDAMELPNTDDGDEIRDVMLSEDHAEVIDNYLHRYQYASRDHVLWTLLYGIGVRLGATRSLDIGDVDADERMIEFVHRPDADVPTPLKNAAGGERYTTIGDETATVLRDYIENVRVQQTESDGRKPLLTTENGRVGTASMRRWVYRWTQPCQIGRNCPHGTTADDCDVTGYTDRPSGCPSIVSPHAIRKLVIVQYRREEVPDKFIQDRCNVSQKVIDKNYDLRSERERAEQRRDYFG
jgi:site-specific recombinase XerD